MDDFSKERKSEAEKDDDEAFRGEGEKDMMRQKKNRKNQPIDKIDKTDANDDLINDDLIQDSESGAAGPEGEVVEELKNDLAAARQESADMYDRLLRATAEFENFKKRTQRQVEESRKYANESLIKDLLSVVDNLERAVNASGENLSKEESCMLEGIEMTLSEILKILKNYNVTPIEAQGKPFDPTYHEAVMQEESDDYPENTVVNEFQKGYLLHDRVIRPSMVVVSKGRQKDSK